MEQVQLGYRGEGEFWTPIPQWMIDYQEELSESQPMTIGACLELLVASHHEACLVVDEEDDHEPKEMALEECIAQLRASYGTDRDPISTAVYYLERYAASLAYEKERNG
jgi:hypothetical protein